MNHAVEIRNLTKRYGSTVVVNKISLDVEVGEVFGLLGPNGAGKSTTLECVEGVKNFDSGEITIFGKAHNTTNIPRTLGVQLQSTSLPEGINAFEAMTLFCKWQGVPDRRDLLDRFGLQDLYKKRYGAMSTGQKRRLHLALALVHNPQVVILDEPTAGLDVEGRIGLHEQIRELKRSGITIIMATHDMSEAESLCDRIGILIKGNLATIGTPREITSASYGNNKITLKTARNTLNNRPLMKHSKFESEADGYSIWFAKEPTDAIIELLQHVKDSGDSVVDFRIERPSLEERFMEITGGGKI